MGKKKRVSLGREGPHFRAPTVGEKMYKKGNHQEEGDANPGQKNEKKKSNIRPLTRKKGKSKSGKNNEKESCASIKKEKKLLKPT